MTDEKARLIWKLTHLTSYTFDVLTHLGNELRYLTSYFITIINIIRLTTP